MVRADKRKPRPLGDK